MTGSSSFENMLVARCLAAFGTFLVIAGLVVISHDGFTGSMAIFFGLCMIAGYGLWVLKHPLS